MKVTKFNFLLVLSTTVSALYSAEIESDAGNVARNSRDTDNFARRLKDADNVTRKSKDLEIAARSSKDGNITTTYTQDRMMNATTSITATTNTTATTVTTTTATTATTPIITTEESVMTIESESMPQSQLETSPIRVELSSSCWIQTDVITEYDCINQNFCYSVMYTVVNVHCQ